MINRREFLKSSFLLTAGCLFSNGLHKNNFSAEFNGVTGKKGGLQLAVQTWTFRLFNIEQAIEKARQSEVYAVEISGGIRIKDKGKRASDMTPEERQWIRSVLEENKVQAVSLGGSQGSKKEFDFSAEMGMKVMQGEPPFDKLEEISKRAEEYKIRFALHNHAIPNRYWNYKETLKRLDNCSSWIGFCPDTGHMMRSGIDPLQAVKDLKGKIYSIHLKDLNGMGTEEKPGKDLHDVPWGTGEGQIEAVLKELVDQKFVGPVIIEYEYKWENNVPEVRSCAEFFKKIFNEMA